MQQKYLLKFSQVTYRIYRVSLSFCRRFSNQIYFQISILYFLFPDFLFQFNQELYSSSGVPLAASSSTSAGSHSPCSPLLPSTSALAAASSSNLGQGSSGTSASIGASGAAAAGTSSVTAGGSSGIPGLSHGQSLPRSITKEEDLSGARSDTEGMMIFFYCFLMSFESGSNSIENVDIKHSSFI